MGSPENGLKLVEFLEDVVEKICDGYCKFPEKYLGQYEDPDEATYRMYKEKCDDCPFRLLL